MLRSNLPVVHGLHPFNGGQDLLRSSSRRRQPVSGTGGGSGIIPTRHERTYPCRLNLPFSRQRADTYDRATTQSEMYGPEQMWNTADDSVFLPPEGRNISLVPVRQQIQKAGNAGGVGHPIQ